MTNAGITSTPSIGISPEHDDEQLLAFWRAVWPIVYAESLGLAAVEKLINGLDMSGKAGIVPRENGIIAFSAKASGHIVGTCIVRERNEVAYCWGMYVDPAHQRKGLGSSLLALAEKSFKTAGRLVVHVLDTSPWAVSFYKKQGFYLSGTTEGEIGPGVAMQQSIMTKQLDRRP